MINYDIKLFMLIKIHDYREMTDEERAKEAEETKASYDRMAKALEFDDGYDEFGNIQF